MEGIQIENLTFYVHVGSYKIYEKNSAKFHFSPLIFIFLGTVLMV